METVSFIIDGGVITEALERRFGEHAGVTRLTDSRDIEDAVARVANTPVGGKEDSSDEKRPLITGNHPRRDGATFPLHE